MWDAVLPVAMVPLWQFEQPVVTETLAWNLAGNQLTGAFLWQLAQLALVLT
jgi:hypothetical protein